MENLIKKTMLNKTVLHRAGTRGAANHGWLESYHSFSFANYYNPERMNFGALRVLNDDIIAGGMGFRTHPHDNMEIISIGLDGALEHKDSMGNVQIIGSNDVQIMSAGSGITHSEANGSPRDLAKFLQIWIFPNVRNATPRYAQKTFAPSDRENRIVTVVAPDGTDENAVPIRQNAWVSLANLSATKTETYDIKSPENGVYIFVLSGTVVVDDETLNPRDAYGIAGKTSISLKANTDAAILFLDVPMLT